MAAAESDASSVLLGAMLNVSVNVSVHSFPRLAAIASSPIAGFRMSMVAVIQRSSMARAAAGNSCRMLRSKYITGLDVAAAIGNDVVG